MTGDDAWADLRTRVQAWIEDDPDPQTADELRALLTLADAERPDTSEPDPTQRQVIDARREARAELADRFSGLLQFGTAGLRGRLGGGPHRMNRAVVIRAASGLADYLLGELDGVHPRPRVVIGYDARHRSVDFARDSAAVLTAVGIEVLVLPESLPTPVLAFAVRHLDADAGIMVTASHNPREDNGYKVYLGGRVVTGSGQGSQIVPPADAAIAAEIAHVPSVASVPRATDGWTVLGFDVLDAYVDAVVALAPTDEATRAAAAKLKIVLTALHGVGGEVAQRVLTRAGFGQVLVVPEQFDPDPEFPSIAFPNPEEPGAIDMATGLASDQGADLVIALDPDADRCAVAVQDPRHRSHRGPDTAEAEGWRMLHGDETGALLGTAMAARWLASDADPDATTPTFASSIVSSRLLGKIARSAGLGLRADAHGLQVDLPRRPPGVRVRGGARLLRGPGTRARQGRHLRGAPHGRSGRAPARRGTHPDRRPRRHRPHARPAPDRPGVRPVHRAEPDPAAGARGQGALPRGRSAALASRRWSTWPPAPTTTATACPRPRACACSPRTAPASSCARAAPSPRSRPTSR